MCCRSDAVPSPSPSAVALELSETPEISETLRVPEVFNASAPASGWSSPSCASA